MVSIFDGNVHVVLEHVGRNLHKLKYPLGLFTASVIGLSVVDLLSNFYMDKGRHFVERAADFVVQLGVEDVEF